MLVTLQFLLLAALAWPVYAGLPHASAIGLVLAGVVLGVWSLVANRPGNFNIRPEVKPGSRFIERGPYRFVRHPMYVAVLVVAAGLVAWQPAAWRGGAWLALAGVLYTKTRIEEVAMLRAHPSYAAYRARTSRWLPFLW
ncbi:MAG: isoprenylcysteine carboxylmethyltransferase family protein [Casimicrobiaceae bacterium]